MSMLAILTGFLAAGALDQAPADSSNARDPNEMICRTISDTGSRLTRSRVCLTRAQWAERRRASQADIESSQSRRMVQPEG